MMGYRPPIRVALPSDVGKQTLVPYPADYVFFRKAE
jgi:hypothetical protein